MDGFSLGLKKLIFSKRESTPIMTPRSGRERTRVISKGKRKNQSMRDTSPFEEVRPGSYELSEAVFTPGNAVIEKLDSPDDKDVDESMKKQDVSEFEEILWPEEEDGKSPGIVEELPSRTATKLVDDDGKGDERLNGTTPNHATSDEAHSLTDQQQTSSNNRVKYSADFQSEDNEEMDEVILRPKGSEMLSLSESIQDELDDIELRAKAERHQPITKDQFLSYFDTDGRIVDENQLRRTLFKGGVEKEIRQQVWQFLFELYPCNSTTRERDVMKMEHSIRYDALKARWRPLLLQIAKNPNSGVQFCPEWIRKRKLSTKVFKEQSELHKEKNDDIVRHGNEAIPLLIEVDANIDDVAAIANKEARMDIGNIKKFVTNENDLTNKNATICSPIGIEKGFDDINVENLGGKNDGEGMKTKMNENGQIFMAANEVGNYNQQSDEISVNYELTLPMTRSSTYVDEGQPIANVHGCTVENLKDAITEAMMEEPLSDLSDGKDYQTEAARNENESGLEILDGVADNGFVMEESDFVVKKNHEKEHEDMSMRRSNIEAEIEDKCTCKEDVQREDGKINGFCYVFKGEMNLSSRKSNEDEDEDTLSRRKYNIIRMIDKTEESNEEHKGLSNKEGTELIREEDFLELDRKRFPGTDEQGVGCEEEVEQECIGENREYKSKKDELETDQDVKHFDDENGFSTSIEKGKEILSHENVASEEPKKVIVQKSESCDAIQLMSNEENVSDRELIAGNLLPPENLVDSSESCDAIQLNSNEENVSDRKLIAGNLLPPGDLVDSSGSFGGDSSFFSSVTGNSPCLSVRPLLVDNDVNDIPFVSNQDVVSISGLEESNVENDLSDINTEVTGFEEELSALQEEVGLSLQQDLRSDLISSIELPCVDSNSKNFDESYKDFLGNECVSKDLLILNDGHTSNDLAEESSLAAKTSDISPIRPLLLTLETTGSESNGQPDPSEVKGQSSMPQWLQQQLKASSPAGTKTARTIRIHEEGMSSVEDSSAVMPLKEITDKANLAVRKRLIEQERLAPRASTPVEQLLRKSDKRKLYKETDNENGQSGRLDYGHGQYGHETPGHAEYGEVSNEGMENGDKNEVHDLKIETQQVDDVNCLLGDDDEGQRSVVAGQMPSIKGQTECDLEGREYHGIETKANIRIHRTSLSNTDLILNDSQRGLESSRKAFSAVNLNDSLTSRNANQGVFNALKNLDESISKSDSSVYKLDKGGQPRSSFEPHDSETCLYCGKIEKGVESDDMSGDLKQYIEIQAKVHAGRQVYDIDLVCKALRIIDKDVPRTDRELPYFRENENPNLLKLRDALITYAFFHPDVGYAQGMNDIMSRFFVVMESEVDAYWMFCNYMEYFKGDFMESDMLRKISLVEQLLMKMDRELYDFFQNLQLELIFCHRWLLLSFKREFSYEDGLRIFEIMSSRHLEVSSIEAEMERSRERARELEKDEGSRMEEIYVSPEYSFDVFVCVAMLHECRDVLMSTNDIASIYQILSRLPQVNDLDVILSKAEDLFFQYCRKSTMDCFQLIDEPVEQTRNWRDRFHFDF